ncbi:MAG TPA: MFS transporter [Rhodocyclaceae bacterium]|nr:MFS transporter [Rhodocyclaceae bacterium]
MKDLPAKTAPRRLAPSATGREVWAWAMYDFANSGYTTVVITALFNAYFVAVVAGGAPWATFAWTAALALSYALIMLSAPLLGAWADIHAAKKKLLLATTVGCVLCTAGLALAGPGDLGVAVLFVVLSNFFFGSGENLIAAFLPELAHEDGVGTVSGWGWSLGYMGGLVSLGACLAYVAWAQAHGLGATNFVPVSMLITAALFALSSIPTFLWLQERALPQGPDSLPRGWVADTFARLAQTLRQAQDFVDLRRLLVCIVFYQAGIQAVITLAAVYAEQAMKFTTQQTLVLIVVVNLMAAIGAFAFGYLQDRLGHIRSIALTLVGWIAMTLLAWSAADAPRFWAAAALAGICLGASQSAARAAVAVLSPATRRGEFFGLWGLAVKLSSIVGPLTYGLVTWLTAGDHRLAILVTGSYFVAGLLLLSGIDLERGKRAAQAAG